MADQRPDHPTTAGTLILFEVPEIPISVHLPDCVEASSLSELLRYLPFLTVTHVGTLRYWYPRELRWGFAPARKEPSPSLFFFAGPLSLLHFKTAFDCH